MRSTRDIRLDMALVPLGHSTVRAIANESQRTRAEGGRYCNSGMIQSGASPRATRWQLSKALRKRAGWLSQVGPA